MAIDHFETHYHKKGQIDWNFNILFDDQPAVVEMTKEYAEIIKHPGLYDPIPSQWLHSTILRVGLVGDYTEDEMMALASKLEPRLRDLKLPAFRFDSWWLWGGVVLHISPEDEFTKIYDEVIAALEAAVGSARTTKSPHGSFIAHTTLAYTRTHDKEKEIHELLVAHPVKPATFRATHLALIKQWSNNGHYEWEIVKNFDISKK